MIYSSDLGFIQVISSLLCSSNYQNFTSDLSPGEMFMKADQRWQQWSCPQWYFWEPQDVHWLDMKKSEDVIFIVILQTQQLIVEIISSLINNESNRSLQP